MKRDRFPPKERKTAASSVSAGQAQRFVAGGTGFLSGLLRVQRIEAILALQRQSGNQAACSTPTLRCSARAGYSNIRNIQVSAPFRAADGSWEATGTLVATFSANPTIRVPPMPRGLSRCARDKVQELINTELMPHEREHRSRFLTTDPQNAYVGRATETLVGTGSTARAARRAALQQCQSRFQTILAERLARNRQYAINEIDPFSVTADISDCPECQPPSEE
jgi:hypothetical protein